ncbi:MAG TPA: Gfo/Idh/MocA family oxidoreductase [Ignavibacteriales bacterium]|nr:Gfo/Idh/MocA family oxidoreductase [Ignavibacteriales bacterium]
MKQEPVAAGLAGFGVSGKFFHAPFITANPKFKLKKIFKRSGADKIYGADVVSSFNDILSDKEIELVVITLPNDLHFEAAKEALEAGKHVILEKPFTINSADGEKLINLANDKNLILSVYHNRRLDGDFLTVRKIISGNMLGKLAEYESHFDRFRNFIKEGAWRESGGEGSGILYDLGSHLIDQALVLFGKPKSVFADLRIQRPHGKAVDYFEILFDYGYMKAALKSGMLVKEEPARFILRGVKGTYIKKGMDPQEDALRNGAGLADDYYGIEEEDRWGIFYSEDGSAHKIKTERGDYREYYDNIYDAIRNNKKLLVKPEEALDVIRIIEKCRQSAAERKWIDL